MGLPASPYADYERTGMDKMIKLAKVLCKTVAAFEVIIRAKFPDNGAIIVLLEAIKNVCLLLPAADAEFAVWELSQQPPPIDSGDTAGIDPTAPPAADPDLV
jgi:hypothetical protein